MKKPDKTESALRLGCGGVAGFLFGSGLSFIWLSDNLPAQDFKIGVGAALVFAVAAYFKGDRFWIGITGTLRWFTRH